MHLQYNNDDELLFYKQLFHIDNIHEFILHVKVGYKFLDKIYDTTIDYGALNKGIYKNSEQYKLHRQILETIDCGDYEKYQKILEKNKGKNLDTVLETIQMTFNLGFLCRFLKGETIGIKPFKPDDVYYKIATKPKYLRFYSMLEYAIHESNNDDYNAIVEKYKNSKEFNFVLKYYNKDMEQQELSRIYSKMIATQDKYLMSVLEKFDIIA